MSTRIASTSAFAWLLLALIAACQSGTGAGSGDGFWVKDGGTDTDADSDTGAQPAYADTVIAAPGATEEPFGDPQKAANGVYGCGAGCSSEDVFSLGYEIDLDNHITLRWQDRLVQNGPGADLVVFENGFRIGDGPAHFMDHVIVSVSLDGQAWVVFPHDYLAADEGVYEPYPELWDGFGGVMPVLFNEDTNPVDPFATELAGGDHFDLDELPADDTVAQEIVDQGFRFVKLATAPSQQNPDTGEPFVADAISNGADIDGVYARYLTDEIPSI